MGGAKVQMRVFRYFLIIAAFFCADATAQVGNEWINIGQPYFKIPVAKEGIYKLDFMELQVAGFPVGAVDPSRIQLFHRGIEQAIYVEGEGDGQFDPADFIEFYGRKNDGTLDAELYSPASSQPHRLYNLYSDTTSYFLTVGSLPGKRMVSFFEENTGGLVPETSHTDEKLLLLTTDYSPGIDYGEIQKTTFDVGEGWTGKRITQNQFEEYTLANIVQREVSGGLPNLELLMVGWGPMQHQGEVYVGAPQRLVASFNFTGYEAYRFAQDLAWSDVAADGTLTVRVKVVGVGGQPDRFSVSYIALKYPQRLDISGVVEKTFVLAANPSDKSYVVLENPSPGLRLFDVTDPENPARIGTTESSTLNAIVPSTSTSRRIYASSLTITPVIKPVSFREIIPGQHDYIIISNPLLRKAALGYSDPVKGYAEYRASAEGGGYDTLVVNVQQLYDQFNYGESSPLAIFHFMKFLTNGKLPKYLLLIGKGLDVNYQYFRNPNSAAFKTFKDFVPSAGVPGADIAYTAGLAGTQSEPAVPTGRIPALKPEDIAAYLDKVKEMEALPHDALWRKDILHLSGGIYADEPQRFKDYMKDFQAIAEDYHLGGRVSALAKYSTEIQFINVAEQVNSGLNLLTFFGHSSASTTDFEIGYATDPVQGYDNKGKYPVLLMNGCNAGSSFLTYTIFGEDWVTAKDRGAVGFIAHSAYGFVNLLKKYTETFYAVGYQDSVFITRGIGDIQKETARRYMQSTSPSPGNITQVQQMILLGDPAIRLFGATKTDLEINENNISIESFNGQPLTALADSFAVNMIIRNFGLANKGNFRIEIERTLNDNTVIVYDSLYPSVKYSDTISFVISKGKETGFGNNSFRVTLDPDNQVPELTKENNMAVKNFFMPLNGTKNLFPVNYAIVNDPEISLAFQTTDLLAGEREFLVELDTANTFDSPYKKQFSVRDTVLARQKMMLLAADTLAYYWRTKLAGDTSWTQSSFTYIENGPTGWAQVDFPQYLENQTVGLVKDAELKRLNFLESIVTPLSVTTYGSNHPAPYTDVSVTIANAEYNLYGPGYDCRDNSINLIAFDRKSTVPYTAVQFEWFNRAGRNCGRKPWVINNYIPSQMVTGNNDDIIQYVDNVQAGDSVLIYSIGDAQYSAWPAAARIKLGELGISVSQLDALQDGEPVIILGRKGTPPGTAKFFVTSVSPKDQQALSLPPMTITGGYTAGSMHSTLIGPASHWGALLVQPTEIEAVDQVSFEVVGIKLNGNEEVFLDDVTGDQDLSLLDAVEFPYVRITFDAGDETNLTAAQLNKWLVTFLPVPEGLLLYKGDQEQVLLQEGETWRGTYAFENIAETAFVDSLTVRYEVFNQTSRTSQLENLKIKAPLPGEATAFTVQLNTTNKAGLNDVEVYINPRLMPEQYYDNNILQLNDYLNVKRDLRNPVLEVSIDGRLIANGDFVSPDPLILARIWDENKHILKTDTAGVRIFLTYPCGLADCAPVPILLTNEEVSWRPATDTSAFEVEFRPKNLIDGEYKLRIEGADARGNRSGVDPYEVTFTVKNESEIIISDPYPNPFKDAVIVNIIISGRTTPEQFDFRIVDVNGQMVSHFESLDLPPFHIGTNTISWNGNNNNGNPLPNGIYIYKLSLLLNENQFTKIGKLVLVR
ncbi:MAG: C25 family cysteine peptidase [Cyclobacteriaceae bacterium]|nr:C25 family cysteine peptidase [Cyclobacteriaceae bacterium]